ncbi:MAG: cation diffusion facilitator family transporter [Nitrospinota bacterium]
MVRQSTPDAHPGATAEAPEPRTLQGLKVTWAAIGVNLLLALTKGAGGILGASQALLADALNSLADVATDIAILFALRFASRPPDPGHPYGHGHLEPAASFGVGLTILLGGLFLLGRSAWGLWTPQPYQPSLFTLPLLVAAIALKEGLCRATLRAARRTRNMALLANAWNQRLDVFSSSAAFAGVGLALLGHWWADALAAAGVAGLAAWVGARIVQRALDELMDAAPPEEVLGRIRSAIEGVEGVRNVHALRIHRAGHRLFVDVHIEVPPEISVTDGHAIAHQGQESVLAQVSEVSEVHVHIEPDRGPKA